MSALPMDAATQAAAMGGMALGNLEEIKKILMGLGYSAEQLENMDPAAIQAIYDDYAGKEGLMQEQRDRATALRDASRSGLGGTQAGDLFVADSPWEAVGALGGEYMNSRKQGKIDEQAAALSQQKAMGQAELAKLNAMGVGGMGGGGGDPRSNAIRQAGLTNEHTSIPAGGGQGLPPGMLDDEERRRRMMMGLA